MTPITLRELVRDTAATHGHTWAATYWRKRVCFTHFYWLAFGRLPRRPTCGQSVRNLLRRG